MGWVRYYSLRIPTRGLRLDEEDEDTLRDPGTVRLDAEEPAAEDEDEDEDNRDGVWLESGFFAGARAFPCVEICFSFPSMLDRRCRWVESGSSKMVSSSAKQPKLLLMTDSLGDFLCGECSGSFAAIFFSDSVIVSTSVLLSAPVSESSGVERTDRGRLPWAFLRGLGGASFTGDGQREGSFSLVALARSSSSSSDIIV